MKAVYFVACVAAALVSGQTATTTKAPTPAPTTIKALCTSVEISQINQLESTPSYNKCRSDAQKQIFDGRPDDICAVPSCVVAVQNLVGKYPRCVFDTRVPANDVLPYAKQCNVDPLKTTPPETTTVKPRATVDPNSTVEEEVITTTAAPKTTSKVTTPTTTPVPTTSAASTLSVALTASVALVYSVL